MQLTIRFLQFSTTSGHRRDEFIQGAIMFLIHNINSKNVT